ncbi:MAG: HD-GYP domain-containing protein [Bdellovibrionaceae bacterium]|nr:HD-GYP domain-containing protein [Pseudobdellovibrionaceae bacterium]MDW8189924.1 HD-GYP domain-containing protein [Pseudobdellovibrionaceae bacterium]
MESKPQYFKIRLHTILPDTPLPFDLFVKINDRLLLYVRQGDSLTKERLATLLAKDTGYFYVKEDDRWTYRNFMKSIIREDQISVTQKAQLLKESALGFVEEIFEKPDVYQALDESKPLIQDFINLIDEQPEALSDMISLSSHDFYTYNHSLDVAIYSLGLGHVLGYDKKTLENLGVGALFHDIGKRLVPVEILCKKGGLSEEDWAIIHQHPQFGLDILINKPEIDPGIIAACFEHHESWSGSGYPQKLRGEEIHPFGRIVAITDTFDAMTTQRSYNTPMFPREAIAMMKNQLKGRYDPHMVEAMSEALFHLNPSGAS